MSHYDITISTDAADPEYRVLLRGPGIDLSGRRYVFATAPRAAAFAETVNFAYEQGLRDGSRRAREGRDKLWLVTGDTPDSIGMRVEGWWERLKRRLRARA